MEKRVYIKTYGCQMNERESESLRAILEDRGYRIVGDEHSADIVLLNTCSVREQAEAKAIGKSNLLVRGKNQGKLVGIFGCMAQNLGETLRQKSPNTRLIVGPNAVEKIPEYLDQLIRDHRHSIVDREIRPIDKEFAAAHEQNQLKPSMFVGIMQGCNMRCSYCIVPKTRGPEQYRPMEDIFNEIYWLGERGVKEITLLGQIVNHYGTAKMPWIKGKSPFVQLLEKIHSIDPIRRIDFLSPHPTGFKEDLIDAYAYLPKLCYHDHLPFQSGS
ncbi:MAG: radical SAM protein, partial [Puniceicoccales bacterium]|nr:radical SAM protein [Puniceicoccales bacterium]